LHPIKITTIKTEIIASNLLFNKFIYPPYYLNCENYQTVNTANDSNCQMKTIYNDILLRNSAQNLIKTE